MLRASFLTVALSSTSMALLGDWKVWTPTLQPRMAVVNDNITWVATSSGVVEWDLQANSSRIHTRLDGLPTMDYAAVVLDSQKTVWAIGTDGRIGYQTKGSSSWQTASSYSSQNWVFSPRAAQYWKGYLVFGTDHGLSLYSTTSHTAEDYAKTFGSLTGTVHAVMVTPGISQGGKSNPDTLWVGLDQGIAFATPQWDSIGRPGYFLADPSKWTEKSKLDTANPDLDLIRDANGVRASSWWAEWSDATGRISILGQTGQVKWDGNSQTVPEAIHAAPAGSNVVVSTLTRGTYLVGPTGVLQKAEPEGNFPDYAPVNARFKADGIPYVLSPNVSADPLKWSYRVLTFQVGTSIWIADSIRSKTSTGTQDALWYNYENLNRHRQSLALGPKGEIVIPSWSHPSTLGGIYSSNLQGEWTHFIRSDNDTCQTYAEAGHLESGSAITSARSVSDGPWKGTWLSALARLDTDPSRILFLVPGGQTAPTCLDIPRENTAAGKDKINDFLPIGDTLWLGSAAGLIRVPSPRPSYPPPLVAATYINPADKNTPNIYRLAKTTFLGKDWIVGAATGRLTLYPAQGGWGNPARYDLITSDSSAPTLNQDYYALAVDAQGQIWAGGKDGIDIVQLVAPEMDSLAPSFRQVQRITTADGLLDNTIYDFDLQVSTGKALIASPHGVALWSSPFRPVAVKLAKSGVRVYPNPVRLRDHQGGPADKTLIVDGATADSQLDLLAADGTLVMHLDQSQQVGGRFQVDLPAPSKLRPGLYFWSLKDKRGSVRGPLLIAE